jgi:Tol biopolymer transport system component
MSEVAPQLTAELLADSAVPLYPVISPDGRWVAYVITTTSVKERRLSALWVAPADASSPPARLTAGTAWAAVPRWAPDMERNHQIDPLRRTRAWFGRWLGDPAS